MLWLHPSRFRTDDPEAAVTAPVPGPRHPCESAGSLLPQRLAPATRGDSLDWKDYDAPAITKRVTDRVGPGSIVLFHNAALHTPEALPGILEWLQGNGYEIVPVSELILPGEYGADFTIDHTGRQIPMT